MAELDLHFGAGLALGVGETGRHAHWMDRPTLRCRCWLWPPARQTRAECFLP